MNDSKAVQDIYQSLKAGENKFNFSQLQEALRESGVDVENFNLERNHDQQALLCVAEKFLLDSQKKTIIQPVLLVELPVTGKEDYWEQWERVYNRSLTSLYRNSNKVLFLSRKRELNLC